MKSQTKITLIKIALLTIIIILGMALTLSLSFLGLRWLASNKIAIGNYCSQLQNYVYHNNPQLVEIVTTTWQQGLTCASEECQKKLIYDALQTLDGSDDLKFFGTSYLIRLNEDENIEKWFWDSPIHTTIPKTEGEQRVVALLKGEKGKICTQGYKTDGNYTTMTYLKDMHAEAELIIPIKNDVEIIGAWVSRWGD